MWNGRTVSVVLPTYNEKDSIAETIRAFDKLGVVDGSAFGLEMLMLAVVGRDTIVQVPVNYHPRIGTSAVTGDTRTAIRLGLQMLWIVLTMRLRPPRRQQRPAGRRSQDQAAQPQPLRNSWGQEDQGAPDREREDADHAQPDHADHLDHDQQHGQLRMEPIARDPGQNPWRARPGPAGPNFQRD